MEQLLSRLIPVRNQLKTTLLLATLTFSGGLVAGSEPVSTNADGVAAGGHDVTAYFELKKGDDTVIGKPGFSAKYKGATWRFIRSEDRDRFNQTPEKFAPAFNGHCANALSLGEGLIRTSGETWLILDEKLYFFYAPRGAKRWLNGNYKQYLSEARTAWNAITKH